MICVTVISPCDHKFEDSPTKLTFNAAKNLRNEQKLYLSKEISATTRTTDKTCVNAHRRLFVKYKTDLLFTNCLTKKKTAFT